MEKDNYNNQMMKKIAEFAKRNVRPRLLLHSCCGPCSSSVIEKLYSYFEITVFYFNPCIFPDLEFQKRKETQKEYIEILKSKNIDIDFVETENQHNRFLSEVQGLENDKEGQGRCYVCYKQRLKETCEYAKQNKFDIFCSTLSVSPHKNCEWLNEIGKALEKEYQIEFLPNDFKKDDGYLKSIVLAKENNLYRQTYCGCEFSKE